MDLAALIISIISFLVALMIGILTHYREKKLNRTNLEAFYFNEIFKEYLITKIPQTRRYTKVKANGEIDDPQKLSNVLQNLIQDSLYYKYNDTSFFEELSDSCRSLEDYIISKSEKKIRDDELGEYYNTIQVKTELIYKTIHGKFLGKSFNKKK